MGELALRYEMSAHRLYSLLTVPDVVRLAMTLLEFGLEWRGRYDCSSSYVVVVVELGGRAVPTLFLLFTVGGLADIIDDFVGRFGDGYFGNDAFFGLLRIVDEHHAGTTE